MPPIALLTDFGTDDWFVSELKGVIYGISSDTPVIDISHQIPPGALQRAAFVLMVSFSSFPINTIFCVPIDPDVSDNYPAIALQTPNYTFIAPDNGVLSWILKKTSLQSIYKIENAAYFRKPYSSTFRGRDLFAPVAAYLSKGISPQELGPKKEEIKTIPFPEPTLVNNKIQGEILYCDHFGNSITNIPNSMIPDSKNHLFYLDEKQAALPIVSTYKAASQSQLMMYKGSSGYIEIGIYKKNAAQLLNLQNGTKFHLSLTTPRSE